MPENDKRILELLKRDDERALDEIFHLYFNRLYHFSVEFVKNKEEAREIVQDAMMRFWQRRNYLKDDTGILSYLLIIVRNLSLNYLRQYKKHGKFIISGKDVENELSFNYEVLADPVWNELLAKETTLIIERAISSLTEKCRKVFELSRFEEMSNIEISQQLNISVKTVEGHITEALKSIRIHLSKYMSILLIL